MEVLITKFNSNQGTQRDFYFHISPTKQHMQQQKQHINNNNTAYWDEAITYRYHKYDRSVKTSSPRNLRCRISRWKIPSWLGVIRKDFLAREARMLDFTHSGIGIGSRCQIIGYITTLINGNDLHRFVRTIFVPCRTFL